MFVILLFGKFVGLFLMVVHHLEFAYVVGGALGFDLAAVGIGSLSVSTRYLLFLTTNTTFLLWVR